MIPPLTSLAIAAPCFVISFAVAAFGVALALRERDRPAIPALSFLFFLVALWLLSKGNVVIAADETSALFWTRVAFATLPLIPFALWHFVIMLLGPTRLERMLFPAIWTAAIVLVAWGQAGTSLVQSIDRRSWGFYWTLGSGRFVLIGLFIFFLALSLWRLTIAWRVLRPRISVMNLKRIALSIAVASLGLIDFLPSSGSDVPPVGAIAVGFSIVLLFPVFWHRRFFGIKQTFSASRIMETMKGAMLVVDLDGNVRLANRAAAELLDVDPKTLMSARINDLIESPRNVGPASDTLMRGDSFDDRPMLWRRKRGGSVEVSVSASMLRDEQGLAAGLIYLAMPISDPSRADQVTYQAYHDSLTGLPNRKLYHNRVEEGLELFSRKGRIPAVIFLDIDNFKLVNDSLGQLVGDQLLQLIGRRLRNALRGDDLVARVGGDEYAVFVDLRFKEDLDMVVDKLRETFEQPFMIEDEEVYVTSCAGAAIWPDHGDDADELLRNADAALSQASKLGKNRFEVFGESIRHEAVQRYNVASSLRKAVENGEFELHYQPILELAGDRIVGAEALIRWKNDQNLLQPAEFVRIAEESGLIRQIGEWVIAEACRRGREWEEKFGISKLSVNLSAAQMEDHSLAQIVAAELSRSGMSPGILELEITESAAMADFEQTIFLLDEMKEIGVSIAIDDFGTGYSSLSYLQRFPIDVLKIDQSFVRELSPVKRESPIISATIAIARALGLEVTAEGVENRFQLAFMRIERCRYVQGFGISQPLTAESFEEFLQNPQYPLKNADLDATVRSTTLA